MAAIPWGDPGHEEDRLLATITLLDGKKLVVKTLVDDVVERVIGYRQLIARGPLRLVDTPPLAAAAAVIKAGPHPTPIRPRGDSV